MLNTARAAAFVGFVTLHSAIWTSLLVVPILCWQVTSWIFTGEWWPLPISRALALAGLEYPAIYVTPRTPDPADITMPRSHDMISWFLDFPTVGLLLVVAAILLAFSISAASIQKRFAGAE